MAKIVHVAVEKVQTAGLQTRVAIDLATVREYAEAVTAGGVTLPPIVVFKTGDGIWCADGLHRLAAAKLTGQKTIAADCRDGGRGDALRYALGANGAHGLRRTNADKAQAVKMAYEHRAVLGLPDVPAARLIGEIVGVSDMFVTSQLQTVCSWSQAPARTGADGKTRDLPPVPTRRTVSSQQLAVNSGTAASGRGYSEAADPAAAPPIDRTAFPPPPVRRSAPTPATPDAGPVDECGKHIPEDLLPVWNRRQEVQDAATAISRVRTMLAKAQDGQDPLWGEVNYSILLNNLDRAYSEIAGSKPYVVCPMCQGIGCRACKGRGLLGKYRYDNCVPSEFKLPSAP